MGLTAAAIKGGKELHRQAILHAPKKDIIDGHAIIKDADNIVTIEEKKEQFTEEEKEVKDLTNDLTDAMDHPSKETVQLPMVKVHQCLKELMQLSDDASKIRNVTTTDKSVMNTSGGVANICSNAVKALKQNVQVARMANMKMKSSVNDRAEEHLDENDNYRDPNKKNAIEKTAAIMLKGLNKTGREKSDAIWRLNTVINNLDKKNK